LGAAFFSISNINLKNNDKNIITKDINFKDDNLSKYSDHNINLYDPIISLKDITDFKSRKQVQNPYIGLLKGKEDSKYKLGKLHILPKPSDYHKYDNIADWEFIIRELITHHLDKGVTYDLAVLGRDVLNEEYISYGKHFLINNESNVDAVITKIQGNIDVTSISLNSGEIDVAENNSDIDSGLRVIKFAIRSVSFDIDVHKAANKLLLEKIRNKNAYNNNKIQWIKIKNTNIKALFNSIPNSSKM